MRIIPLSLLPAIQAMVPGIVARECKDLYLSCKSMVNFCGRPEYQGVDEHCPQTCKRCDEKRTGTSLNDNPLVNEPEVVENTVCKDKSWCNTLMCTTSQYRQSCPITCRNPECAHIKEAQITSEGDHEHLDARLELCYDKSKQTCPELKHLCDHDAYGPNVRKECRATCGVCQTQPIECKDVTDCSNVKHMCDSPYVRSKMMVDCPKTCGFCGGNRKTLTTTVAPTASVLCVDQGPQCAEYKERCDDPAFGPQMKKFCPQTCNACHLIQPTTAPTTTTTTAPATTTSLEKCANKNKNCAQMARYCNHKIEENRKKVRNLCPKTCGVCSEAPITIRQTTRTTTTTTTKTTKRPTTRQPITERPSKLVTTTDSGPVCEDRTPKWCVQYKTHCKKAAALKTMKYKCSKTCGFCSTTSETWAHGPTNEQQTTTKTPITTKASVVKFGEWSPKWSKCNRGTQYVKRRCLIQPCTKRQLFKVQKC